MVTTVPVSLWWSAWDGLLVLINTASWRWNAWRVINSSTTTLSINALVFYFNLRLRSVPMRWWKQLSKIVILSTIPDENQGKNWLSICVSIQCLRWKSWVSNTLVSTLNYMGFLVRRFQASLPLAVLSKREGSQLEGRESVSQSKRIGLGVLCLASWLSWYLYLKFILKDIGGIQCLMICSAVCLGCHLGLPLLDIPLCQWRLHKLG